MTLPDDFKETGLHLRHNGTAPTRFHVLGERSSGTNFVKRLLGRNTTLKPTEALGWKHGFPAALAIPRDLAVVCVVRNAADWARSMYAKPWHTPPAMQALDFDAFLRAPWETVIDRPRYFDGIDPAAVGTPLQADRDPVTGAAFANLFALRRGKLAGLLSYLDRDCTCVLLRMEAAQAAPEALADRIAAALDLPARSGPFRPVVKRLGSKFKASVADRPAPPAVLNEDQMAFLREQLDPTQEAALGYRYDTEPTPQDTPDREPARP